jgi:sialic acid synthase SpsE
VCIEKHFTLDRALPGPDHKASLEPGELAALVQQVRDITAALGQPIKVPTASEADTRAVARRSIVALEDAPRGTPFRTMKLEALRPDGGLSPMAWWDLMQRAAPADIRNGDVIADLVGHAGRGR